MGGRNPRVVLYSVHGCHLCDSARYLIEQTRLQRQFSFTHIVLNEDDPRFALHAERVPVILVNGREIAHWRITPEQLLNALV